jgi:hypothetical protein
MRKYPLWCGVFLLAAAPAWAQPATPRVVEETWDAAYVEGARTGYVHTTVQELRGDGKKVYRTTLAMHLTVRRYHAVVPLRIETSTDETATGQVLGLSLTHFLDKDRRAVQTARVDGEKLVVRGGDETKEVPWNDRVLGMYRQQQLFRERKVKAGDGFRYLNYELAVLAAVPVTVRVKPAEEVDLLRAYKEGSKPRVERVKARLLRAEAVSDKVKIGDGSIQLPKLVSWLDKDWRVVRSEFDFPGLGTLTLYRTTREVAQQAGVAPELLPDLGLSALIPVKQVIDRPEEARAVVYRITVKGDDDPATTFARDARQQVRNVKGDSFELVVRPLREPAPVEDPPPAREEFLKSSYFLDSGHERVRALAARVAGRETEPLRKARLLEKWVHENMKPSSAVGFATASQTARDLRGDCRQHAMLLAALCRAAEVPARTAVGLIYVRDPDRGPVLGFHMWTEVWVDGQWLGLDATLGRGSVGAGHLKIADHSWHDTQTLAPLLPVARVLGKARVEVVGVR